MKFILFILAYLISIIKSSRFENKIKAESSNNPYLQDFLSQLKFEAGNKIEDLILYKRIYSTGLYETWEILKQEEYNRKFYIAHIFKYTLGSQFPLKTEDLEYFCTKILAYNEKMRSKKSNFFAIPCYNSKVYNQTIPGGVVSYLLFEKPYGDKSLEELCVPLEGKSRLCKYLMKDFANGYIQSLIYAQTSQDPLDVNFILAQKGFHFGKLPIVKKNVNITQTSMRVFKEISKLKSQAETQDPQKHFITIAYPKAYSPESINTNQDKKISPNKLKVDNKKQIVQIGRFLINMYKGLDNSTNFRPLNSEDNFNPNMFTFKNATEIFLSLNTEKNGNYSAFRADDYFGVPPKFITEVKAFLDRRLVYEKSIKQMDDLLNDSFYNFIYQSVIFDVDSKKQFDSYESMLKHKFLTSKCKLTSQRSDTSFDK